MRRLIWVDKKNNKRMIKEWLKNKNYELHNNVGRLIDKKEEKCDIPMFGYIIKK